MNPFRKKRIFLDYAAGKDNPSAVYKEGVEIKRRLEEARTKVARVLQVQAKDVIFTSGGTESDNLAFLGIFEAAKEVHPSPHVVTTSVEHPAVLKCIEEIQRRGGEVTIVEAVRGMIEVERIMNAVKDNTVLISVVYVNASTGAIQPVAKIARRVAELRKKNTTAYPYLHTDASQAVGMLSVQFSSLGVDAMTFGGSKLGAKGAGVLAFRPRVLIKSIMFGGGQERGIRSGTENVQAIENFSRAFTRAENRREEEMKRLTNIKHVFLEGIQQIPDIIINTPEESSPHIVSISFPSALHEFLAIKLDRKGVCVSTGSSCVSRSEGGEIEALRFSFGPETTQKDAKISARILSTIMLE